MKITKVEYSKTFNLGNYQSAKIGFEAEVEQQDIDKATNSDQAASAVLLALQQKVEIERTLLRSK